MKLFPEHGHFSKVGSLFIVIPVWNYQRPQNNFVKLLFLSTEVDPKARELMKKRTSKYNKEMKDTEEKLDEESSPMDPENMESEKGLRRQSPFFKVCRENMYRPNLIPFFQEISKILWRLRFWEQCKCWMCFKQALFSRCWWVIIISFEQWDVKL